MRLILLLSFILPACLARVFSITSDNDYWNDKYYWNDDDTLNDEDYSLFEYPAVPVLSDNSLSAPKYKDSDEVEEEIPGDDIFEEDNDVNEEEETEDTDFILGDDIFGEEDDVNKEEETEDTDFILGDDIFGEEDDVNKEEETEDTDFILGDDIFGEEDDVNEEEETEDTDLEDDNMDSVVNSKVKPTFDGSFSNINNGININRNDYESLRNFMYPDPYPVQSDLRYKPKKSYSLINVPETPRGSTNDRDRSGSYTWWTYPRGSLRMPCSEGYRPDSHGRCRLILL